MGGNAWRLHPAIRSSFETITVNLPKAYDVMLRRGFGDYMQLPPENDRKISFKLGT